MNALAMAALGAIIGFGLLLAAEGVRGQEVLPRRKARPGDPLAARSNGLLIRVVIGLVVGALVLILTRWPVAGATMVGLVIVLPAVFGGRSQQKLVIERTQAIASWTELIRDNLAGAAGLEQALLATAPLAPRAIAAEVGRLEARLERQVPLVDALAAFGDDLAHPSADLVVVAIAKASKMEVRELNPLLSRLAESIRDDVRMRLRVEVSRTRIRQSSRIVIGFTLGVIVLLFIFARSLLVAFNSPVGQLWLCLVVAVFAAAGLLIQRYSRLASPTRFALRRVGPPTPADPFDLPMDGAGRPRAGRNGVAP